MGCVPVGGLWRVFFSFLGRCLGGASLVGGYSWRHALWANVLYCMHVLESRLCGVCGLEGGALGVAFRMAHGVGVRGLVAG